MRTLFRTTLAAFLLSLPMASASATILEQEGQCKATTRPAATVAADCYALTAALVQATDDLRFAESVLANYIAVYEACLQQPGWDCSVWPPLIAQAYDAMVEAEYAYEEALGAWVQGGCQGWPWGGLEDDEFDESA